MNWASLDAKQAAYLALHDAHVDVRWTAVQRLDPEVQADVLAVVSMSDSDDELREFAERRLAVAWADALLVGTGADEVLHVAVDENEGPAAASGPSM